MLEGSVPGRGVKVAVWTGRGGVACHQKFLGRVAGKTKVELSSRRATDTTTTAEPRDTICGSSRQGFVGAAAAAAATRLGLPFHNDTTVVPMANRGRSGLYMDEFCGMGWWHSAGSVKGISIGLFLLVPRLLASFFSLPLLPTLLRPSFWSVPCSFNLPDSLRLVSRKPVILLTRLSVLFCFHLLLCLSLSLSVFRPCSQGRLSHNMAWHKGGVAESGSVGWTSVWYLDGWLAGLVVVDVTSQRGRRLDLRLFGLKSFLPIPHGTGHPYLNSEKLLFAPA